MKLFLCSHTINNNLKKDFENFIGKKCKDLKVAFVWTAAKPLKNWTWKKEDFEPLKKRLGFKLELIDIGVLKGERLKKKLRNFDILWLNGGLTGYLMKKVKESKLEKFLPKLLEEGLIYVGSSAGSMICSKSFEIAEWYIGEPEPGASKIKGLGYIDFQIYPHYKDKLLAEIKKHKPKGETYCLLKDGQAIAIENKDMKFLGGKVKLLK
jgi:dipeptidase E